MTIATLEYFHNIIQQPPVYGGGTFIIMPCDEVEVFGVGLCYL